MASSSADDGEGCDEVENVGSRPTRGGQPCLVRHPQPTRSCPGIGRACVVAAMHNLRLTSGWQPGNGVGGGESETQTRRRGRRDEHQDVLPLVVVVVVVVDVCCCGCTSCLGRCLAARGAQIS